MIDLHMKGISLAINTQVVCQYLSTPLYCDCNSYFFAHIPAGCEIEEIKKNHFFETFVAILLIKIIKG